MHTLTPDTWIAQCAAALVELLDDPYIEPEDLRRVAVELAEDRRFNVLSPTAAAALYEAETR